VEDLAVTRVLPNMTVLAPGDPVEADLATRAVAERRGPCYLRLGKAGEPVVHATAPDFVVGKAITLRTGTDVTLISSGATLELTVAAADALSGRGVSVRVLSMPTLQPLDLGAVAAAIQETGGIVTVEEHGVGGLGSVVAEVIAEAGAPVRFRSVRLRSTPSKVAGSQKALLLEHGISAEHVARIALELC
jgi:transketolase